MFDEVSIELHRNARAKGFYDSLNMAEFNSQAKQLAMMHSEVTEVLEALRKSKGSRAVVEEIADILIRTLDFYQSLSEAGVISDTLDEVFEDKVGINADRPRMHGVLG